MIDKVFLDTNLWIYFYAKDSSGKAQTVTQLVCDHAELIWLSTQILGELFHVLTRKKIATRTEAVEILSDLMDTFPILDIDLPKVSKALEINARYGYTYWDSLILATALLGDCSVIYTEDMHHDQLINGQLRLVNPFL
jgi:predicted nucleic acid-binding protein